MRLYFVFGAVYVIGLWQIQAISDCLHNGWPYQVLFGYETYAYEAWRNFWYIIMFLDLLGIIYLSIIVKQRTGTLKPKKQQKKASGKVKCGNCGSKVRPHKFKDIYVCPKCGHELKQRSNQQ